MIKVAEKLTYWPGPEGTAHVVNFARSDFELPLGGDGPSGGHGGRSGRLTDANFSHLYSQETKDIIKDMKARMLIQGAPFKFEPFELPDM